ncbi:hypothetical protein FIBSPDRAFT_901367 [Athelia psychrophila]|uniref:Uncharacterized protein n=1 Tax=Athelia psychrophila TaxID=1759441 RepID=A0A165X7J4_9AGAM|nr:hypothetical protein FIBSPDRAFT_901367 [Fibularhizoctonia sp. CBS 109695]
MIECFGYNVPPSLRATMGIPLAKVPLLADYHNYSILLLRDPAIRKAAMILRCDQHSDDPHKKLIVGAHRGFAIRVASPSSTMPPPKGPSPPPWFDRHGLRRDHGQLAHGHRLAQLRHEDYTEPADGNWECDADLRGLSAPPGVVVILAMGLSSMRSLSPLPHLPPRPETVLANAAGML